MPFNKFIPAYHHHFGKQCRVSDYGFTKLIELFEAIPSVVDVSIEINLKHSFRTVKTNNKQLFIRYGYPIYCWH